MKTRKLISRLYKIFPRSLAEPWDHVGSMIGPVPEETTRVALALDLDATSLRLAAEKGAGLIITHHPVFFGPRAKVLLENEERRSLYEEARRLGIAAYSFHTNFDAKFPEGMNAALASRLGLLDPAPLLSAPIAVGGRLKEKMGVEAFASYARERLGADYGLLLPCGNKEVETVAIVGGGGSSFWTEARLEGYDIYVSGDAPHYTRRDIANAGYNYLDLPHEIEGIFVERMTEILLNIDQSLTIVPIVHEGQPLLVK